MRRGIVATSAQIGRRCYAIPSLPDRKPIYMDFQATTPVDPRVLDAMIPYNVGLYGNPHSRTHSYGWEVEKAVEDARQHIADLIGANSKDIIFTSGATESGNAAVKGVARFYKAKKNHIITLETEHKCILDSCRNLQREGFEVTYLPVQQNGLVDLQRLEEAIRPDTSLISVMTANNEIGVIQPIEQIGAIAKKHKVFFHTDAAQAVGKIPMDVDKCNIDLLSISGHKLYGPMGVGALYIRRRPRVRLEPIIHGGGQERGYRSGTLSPALCVGLGEAARIARVDLDYDRQHVARLANKLRQGLKEHIPDIVFNGDEESRLDGCINVSFAYVEGESLVMALKDVAISSGSACTSASLEPSYVLRSLGVDDEMAHTSLRIGIGRFTTEREVDYVLAQTIKHVKKLRDMSPLYEMVQEGIDLKSISWVQH